ncbi:uncharacterized protein LOC119073969 isoform X2 [Bradysia coprophila]|uniref:uncharacterized protein LOC119073969 isoform X2 n=1 Tax=Bradysia coprophila TaxID=38358 RepID=UPI00187D831C|nr:uncharacterized protein LOC119073969 isoform X2 [Bradysia coprophila]
MSYPKLPPAQLEGIQVCSISFNRTDRIRLIGLPVDVIESMKDAITRSWGQIQNQSDYYGAFEFKLSGNPWRGQGEDAVHSRRLLAAILTTMARFGWNLLQSADVSKKEFDKDTLFFEKGMPDPDVSLFAMSFNMRDRIRIIDAPSFAVCVQDAIQSQWRNGIQDKRDYYGSIEFKLSGNPWFPNGSDTVYGRMLLCQIIANIRAKSYKLYGSIDISMGHEGQDLESWVFRRVGSAWN